jgi:CobQ-like glutamine amidotransferase family enzyme
MVQLFANLKKTYEYNKVCICVCACVYMIARWANYGWAIEPLGVLEPLADNHSYERECGNFTQELLAE